MEGELQMIYETFTRDLLEKFPDFRGYFLRDYHANEVDLLPSNISFALVHYYDKPELTSRAEVVEHLTDFLIAMRDSDSNDLRILYNEMVNDILNTSHLKEITNNIEKLSLVSLVPEDISNKRDMAEVRGNQYIESNRVLLAEYRKSE